MEQIDQVTMLVQISYTIIAFLFTLIYMISFFIPRTLKLFRARLFIRKAVIKQIKNLRYIYVLDKN